MAKLGALCVYCGASGRGDPAHREAAKELGRMAAERGIGIVFGGGHVGMMGAVADGALAAGGRVTGVIPRHLLVREAEHRGATEMIVVESMHSRKERMVELSDAFCILPGGLGTLDEMFEILTWRQLALHDKPVVVLNLGGYWDPLVRLLEHLVATGYTHREHTRLWQVVARVEEVFDAVAMAPSPCIPSDTTRL
ncbi:MAG TPA: TIGR00730 family Rossman fold protein [Kiloniellales bacterium]